MRKCICCFLVVMLSDITYCHNSRSNIELEETVRYNTGQIEELNSRIAVLEQKINQIESLFTNMEKEKEQIKEEELLGSKTPEQVIKESSDYIEENQTEKARKLLSVFIKKNPSNIFCGMMHFYIGESYYREKDYKNAASAYMLCYEVNPRGAKTAEGLYKLSLCFGELSKSEQRKAILEKLASDYTGEFSEKAKKKLKVSKNS